MPGDFSKKVRQTIGPASTRKIHFGSIYYQDILQRNQEIVWRRMRSEVDIDPLRKWLLYSFSDAASLEARKDLPDSAYERSQVRIAEALWTAKQKLGADGCVVILAQSLGGQLVSNWLWDAQRYEAAVAGENTQPDYGFWKSPHKYARQIADKSRFSKADLAFLGGARTLALFTTGCNIPIFLAGLEGKTISPFEPPSPGFTWDNYYDKDDVLGYPVAPLSADYANLVRDHKVSTGSGGLLGRLTSEFNIFSSHTSYWKDREIYRPLVKKLKSCLAHP